MSKNKNNRAEKIMLREKAKKKAGQKKILIICGCVLVTAAIITLAIFSANRRADKDTNNSFSSGHVHGDSCRH